MLRWAIVLLCLFVPPTQASDVSERKRQVIDELITITGATKIAEAMSGQFADIMLRTMSDQYPELSTQALEVIKDETKAAIYENMIENRWFHQMSYTLYSKYFTETELAEMVAFYKTDTGRKATKVMPQIMQESMIAGGAKGQSLAPQVLERVQTRLNQEGWLEQDPSGSSGQ